MHSLLKKCVNSADTCISNVLCIVFFVQQDLDRILQTYNKIILKDKRLGKDCALLFNVKSCHVISIGKKDIIIA